MNFPDMTSDRLVFLKDGDVHGAAALVPPHPAQLLDVLPAGAWHTCKEVHQDTKRKPIEQFMTTQFSSVPNP